EVVTLAGGSNLLHTLSGVGRQNAVHTALDGLQTLQVDGHIRDLALRACGRLVNHNFGVGQSHALALGACSKQEGAHGGCHANADGSHVTLNVLHGVVDGHAVGDAAAGAVDIELNILVRVLGFQIEKLGNDQGRGGGVDFL